MKVYFSTSIGQMTDQTRASSLRILSYLKNKGHRIISADLLVKMPSLAQLQAQTAEQALVAQKNIRRLKKQADIIVFEVSKPSLAVGQEINIALSLNKPVIALYMAGKAPHILRDEAGDLLILSEYTDADLEDTLKDALEYAISHQDVRFNFFISPFIGRYLDWVSENKKIPRSVYLRSLIEDDMARNPDYKPGS